MVLFGDDSYTRQVHDTSDLSKILLYLQGSKQGVSHKSHNLEKNIGLAMETPLYLPSLK